ncbi:hypothetical protein GX441_06205 [bacterium]|nr:hypothetical protein [bacterium]
MKKKLGFFVFILGLALVSGIIVSLIITEYVHYKIQYSSIIHLPFTEKSLRNQVIAGLFVNIATPIKGNVSVFGAHTQISSKTEGSLLVMGFLVETSAKIKGRTNICASTVYLNGSIDDTVLITAADVIITGRINAPVIIKAPLLVIDSTAEINNSIQHTGLLQASNPEVKNFTKKINPASQPFNNWLVLTLVGLIFLLGIGFVMSSFFSWHLNQTIKYLFEKPVKSAILGSVAILAFPVAVLFAILLAITIIGATAGGIIVVAYIIGFTLSILYVGTGLAQWFFKKVNKKKDPNLLLSMFTGVFVVFLICRIPYAGIFIYATVTVFGFGAFLGRRVLISKQS